MRDIYKACGFYMLRTPTLSTEFFENISLDNNKEFEEILKLVLDKNEIKETIAVASTDLYSNIDKFDIDVKSALLKYLIRASTRTTPYGLFSGVSIGNFNNSSSIVLEDAAKFKKRMRVDMEWLYGVISDIENDFVYIKHLSVKINEMIYIKGDRCINPYVTNLGLIDKRDGGIVSSIKFTNLIKIISENSQSYIKIKELVDIIKDQYKNIDENKIYSYLRNLLKNDYLISNLRPPLIELNQLEYILNILSDNEGFKPIYIKLYNIKNMINDYNKESIGDSVVLYYAIINDMKKIYSKNKNYLQVDTKLLTISNNLNSSIAKEMEGYCSMLTSLGLSDIENINIKEYKKEFIEKYGTNTEVSLLELMDEDMGLGAPIGYTNPISKKMMVTNNSFDKFKNIKDYISHKIIEANARKSLEIEIDIDDIEKINKVNTIEREIDLAPSIELNIIVSADNTDEIDRDNYLLFVGPNIGSSKAGKTFGRFSDIFDEDDLNMIKSEIFKNESEILKDKYLMVEINELLQYGRGNNLTVNSSDVKYELCIGTNPSNKKKIVDINDIYIGVKNDKFYAKSKLLNRDLYFTYHHMMNYMNGSNTGRFLKDITAGYYGGILDAALLFDFKEFERIPRIKYGKIVIVPSSWYINKKMFAMISFQMFDDEFNKWRATNTIPRYVYQKVNDNRLLLDLNSRIHRNELFNILNKSNEPLLITETELGNDITKTIVIDKNEKKYCSEIVVPLVRKYSDEVNENGSYIEAIKTKSIIDNNKANVGISDNRRDLLPGDEGWYYYKLYFSALRADEMVSDYLGPFAEKMVMLNLIDKYFFIRYGDPEFHIRFRFRITDNSDNIHNHFKEFINQLREVGLLNKIQNENYFREIERYGGIEVINFVEDYFYRDSEYVIDLSRYYKKNKLIFDDLQLGISSIICMLNQFGLTFYEQEKLFASVIDKNSHRDIYKKNRRKFMDYSDFDKIKTNYNGDTVYDMINKKIGTTEIYRNAIDRQDDKGLLSNSKDNIILSCIHMFCNRFKGDRGWENIVMALIRHSLYDLKSYKISLEKRKAKEVSL